MSLANFTQRLLILSVFIVIGALLYRIADLLLILFGTVMFSVVLSSAATWLHRKLHIRRGFALAITVIALLVALALLLTLFGARIEVQGQKFAQTLPSAFDRLQALLAGSSWGEKLIEEARGMNLTAAGGNVLQHALGAVSSVFSVASDLILIFFGALYLAAQPDLYLRGALSLLPQSVRPRGAEVMGAIYEKLGRWLLGQFISMVVVGTLFGIALSIIGVPSAIVLGIIAGLFEFIPLLGPVLATVPAALLAITQGFSAVLWVALAFLVIQQTESNLLVPYIQKRAVELPPVVALFATVMFGLLFGLPGLIFAVPLVVTIIISVQEIYVKDILGGPEPESAPELRALVEEPAKAK